MQLAAPRQGETNKDNFCASCMSCKSLIKYDFQSRGGVDMRDNYGSAGEERVSFCLSLGEIFLSFSW